MVKNKTILIFVLVLVLANIFVYGKTAGYDFVNFDDMQYVYKNPLIINEGGVRYKEIFTDFYFSNYQPPVLLSYALENKLYGLNPTGYHITNIILHILNSLLVFYLIFLISGEVSISFIVALFFSLHPVQVESVAWISERKGLMSTLFYLLSFISYIRYEAHGRRQFYYLCIALFALALLSKPMAIMFPVILILYDCLKEKLSWSKIMNKIPFFILSAAAAITTLAAQSSGGSVNTVKMQSVFFNISLVFYNIGFYVIKLISPMNLSVQYDYVDTFTITSSEFYVSLAVIAAAALYLTFFKRIKREINFGILFFIVSLIPILRIIPVGDTMAADRYLYIPSIGFFFAVTTAIYPYAVSKKKLKRVISTVVSIYLFFLVITTARQLVTWKNSLSLWENVLIYTPNHYNAHLGLGQFYLKNNDMINARKHFQNALELNSMTGQEGALFGIGYSYFLQKRYVKAIEYFDRLIKRFPENTHKRNERAYIILGELSTFLGRTQEADRYFVEGIGLFPENAELHMAYAKVLEHTGRVEDAAVQYSLAARYKQGWREPEEALRRLVNGK